MNRSRVTRSLLQEGVKAETLEQKGQGRARRTAVTAYEASLLSTSLPTLLLTFLITDLLTGVRDFASDKCSGPML